MRVWLDPDRVNAVGLSSAEVLAGLRDQNIQVSAGVLNQSPSSTAQGFEVGVQTLGRLRDPAQFENVVVKAQPDGRLVRLGDVARIELGAQSYSTRGYLGTQPAIALPVFQTPGSNALTTAQAIRNAMEELKADFPPGLDYDIAYDPTRFIQQSVDAVFTTIFEAVGLVVLVIVVFLQNWRASIIPIVAIPISLVGTFALMAAFGFSLNNLSLFGLVLAIGIVVDDAIVVVENVERNIAAGLAPREAAHRTMDEVGTALVGLGLVLTAVFVPAAFVPGIAGQFYQQFALTIATATLISVLVSLTLSPALCARLLRGHTEGHPSNPLARVAGRLADAFNRGLGGLSNRYAGLVAALVGRRGKVALGYVVLLVLTGLQFGAVPGGFIPAQDQGYAIVAIELPPGASLERTDAVVRAVSRQLLSVPGVRNSVGFAGFSGATFTNAPNAGTIFTGFKDYDEREGVGYRDIIGGLWQVAAGIDEALVLIIEPPPVRGIGNTGGFRMMVQDRRGRGLDVLESATRELTAAAAAEPGLAGVFMLFNTGTPQIYLDIDRERAERLNVPVRNVFEALEVYIGSAYVNDFNYLGRTFRVTAQADGEFRDQPGDVAQACAPATPANMVPIGSVATFRQRTGPYRVPRYNLYPAAAVQATQLPGISTGEAIDSRWSGWRPRFCPTASPTNGPKSPCSRKRPATRRCSPSGWRWCSCSWCWRRSTKA